MEYMQQIINDQECNSYEKTKRMACNREEWITARNQSQDCIQKRERTKQINKKNIKQHICF